MSSAGSFNPTFSNNQPHIDLEEFDEQITELLSSVKGVLDRDMSRLKGQERIEKCHYLRNRLQRSKQVLRSINVEMKELSPADQIPWQAKTKSYEEQIGKLLQDVEWAENTNTSAPGAKPETKKNIDEMTANDITKHGLQVQDKTFQSTTRAQQALAATIEIGSNTNQELKRQGEKLKEVEEGLDQVESNLKRADKQVRIFVRRLASDKVFLLMIMILVLAIIGVIVIVIMRKNCPTFVQGVLCDKPKSVIVVAPPVTPAP